MSDPAVEAFLLQDVLYAEPHYEWRWTNEHPRVRLWPGEALRNPEFIAHISIPTDRLQRVGPTTVHYRWGEIVLGSRQFDKSGEYEVSIPIRGVGIATDQAVIAGLDVSPPIVTGDGARLGVILYSIGVREAQ